MSAVKPDLGVIGICAALGSAIAGATVGGLFAIGYFEYTDTLAQGIYMLAVGPVAGAILAVSIGGPIGLVVGLIVSRYVGTTIAHSVLTGALTGASYPLFFLIAGLLTGANGVWNAASSFPALIGLGAICGALAHWLVIGKTSARSS